MISRKHREKHHPEQHTGPAAEMSSSTSPSSSFSSSSLFHLRSAPSPLGMFVAYVLTERPSGIYLTASS
ncbi:hypothetical protein EYF80_013096 [Liparis tanakae]|uniref:Uncharacterized protein n=1 Tax=Liparis tanakae TaxID=230148 RepID=A0A4Z2IGS5_9TELE|nr:hypothetical protein EYF80_013096 [Liparis tanakae]